MASKNAVKAVWDRKGLAAKRGHCYIEIMIYDISLSRAEEVHGVRQGHGNGVGEDSEK